MKKKLILSLSLLLGMSILTTGCSLSKVKGSLGGAPVLGDSTKGYEGYKYLYDDVLTSEAEENPETKKMESETLVVYIPQGDSSYVNRTTAESEKMGVNVQLELNPYMRSEQEDFLLTENLEYYFEEESEYEYEDAEELEKTEVEGDDKKAKLTASYCKYDKYEEKYDVYSDTYYMVRLKNDMKLLVKVSVKGSEVTGKTEQLIEELEKFYGFDIAWDNKDAKAKLEEMDGKVPSSTNSFEEDYEEEEDDDSTSTMDADDFVSTTDDDDDKTSSSTTSSTTSSSSSTSTTATTEKFIKFDLPKGWEEDVDDGSETYESYAPDGDSLFADQTFAITKTELGTYSSNLESGVAAMKTMIAEEQNLEESKIRQTQTETKCLGTVYCLYLTEEGADEDSRIYIGEKNGDLFLIMAESNDGTEVFDIVDDVLEKGVVQ